MSVRKAFEDAWTAKFSDSPIPTNLSCLDDEGVSSLATALDASERMIKKLEKELAHQQFIYDFVLQRLNISIAARSDYSSRRSVFPTQSAIATDNRRKTLVSKTPSAPRPTYGQSGRGHGKPSQLAAVMAKIGFGKVNRPAIDPEDEDSSKMATPLSRFYEKSNMYRASSEPSLVDCDRKYKPQPAIPPASRMPPGFKPIFTKDEHSSSLSGDTTANKFHRPDSGSSATVLRKSTGSELDYKRHEHVDKHRRNEMYRETDLDGIVPPSLTPPPRPPPPVCVFQLDVSDGTDSLTPEREHSRIYEEAKEFQREITNRDLGTSIEADNDEAMSSDEEPLYFNILMFKQHTLCRANALYVSGDDVGEMTSPGSSDKDAALVQRRQRRMAHHYEHIEPQLTKPLSIPADTDAGVLSDVTSQSAGASDAINADDRVIADSADTDGVTGDNVSTDSVSVHPKRRSMALAIDGDVPQDSEDLEATVTSDEDEKSRTRQEVISSFLDGERSYVTLLSSLVHFIQKLRSLLQTAQHAVSSEDVNTIFFKITSLHLMHKEFVCDLESALTDEQTACSDLIIGPAFHKLAYQESEIAPHYVNNYQKAVTAIRRCRQNSPAFVELTSSICRQSEDSPSLEDILQEPIERFESTRLILQDLLKFTPTRHTDYDSLQKTLSIAQKYLYADDFASDGSQRETCRYLVDNGLVVEQVGTVRKMRHVFLFNDVLICARQKVSGRERVTFEHKWYIRVCDLELDQTANVQDEKQLFESQQQEVDALQHKVTSLRTELKTEMKHRQSDFKAHAKTAEKIRKKLMEQKAALILAAPFLPLRLVHKKTNKTFVLLMASDFERANWRTHIEGLHKNLCNNSESLSSLDVQDLLNNVKLPARQSTMEALLGTDDFSLEEEYLFGSLFITIDGLKGLKQSADVFCCAEVDSFGHFFMKAKTRVADKSLEPVWDADFDIDLEGAQTLRMLCYKKENESTTLIGKGAFELSKERLCGDSKPEDIILDSGLTVKTSMLYRSRQQTLKRTLSSAKEGLFGVRIRAVIRREGTRIPLIVTTCVKEIEDRGMKDLGLYRVSGVLSEIQKLKKAFEKNSRAAVSLVKNADIHVITGLLKVYLRELPQALFTDTLYPKLVEGFALEEPEAKEKYMRRLMTQLPEPSYSTAMFILDHLIKVSEQESVNKMTLQNLATVFGPTLLRPAEKQTGKLSMEELLSAGARDAMTQIGILRYLLNLKLRGTFGVRL